MPKILDTFAFPTTSAAEKPRSQRGSPDRNPLGEVTIPQLRVLRILAAAKGPLTRNKISSRVGNRTDVVVGRAVGYSDPERRAKFENTKDGGFRPSLLTMAYVQERELDIDGIKERVVSITDLGRACVERHAEYEMPPIRQNKRGARVEELDIPDLPE